jgi:hypothetical protein
MRCYRDNQSTHESNSKNPGRVASLRRLEMRKQAKTLCGKSLHYTHATAADTAVGLSIYRTRTRAHSHKLYTDCNFQRPQEFPGRAAAAACSTKPNWQPTRPCGASRHQTTHDSLLLTAVWMDDSWLAHLVIAAYLPLPAALSPTSSSWLTCGVDDDTVG